MRPLRFISEPIEPIHDERRGPEKRLGCPDGFVWQGEEYRVLELVREWHDYARRGKMKHNMRPSHSAAAERRGSWGVGRDYYLVRIEGGRLFELYYDRAPSGTTDRSGGWFLFRELRDDVPGDTLEHTRSRTLRGSTRVGTPAPRDAADVTIRHAGNEDDMRVILELFEEYAGTLGFELGFQSFDVELETLPGAYGSPAGTLLLAEVDGGAAGCVGLRPLADGICELKRMYVRPAHRGRGIGRMLADAVIMEAAAKGYVRIRLDTIDSMLAAIALYRSLGFKEIPSYRPNPITGAAFFELDLS